MHPQKNMKSSPPSAPKVPDEPMEYVNHIRENSGKRFAHTGNIKDVNYDIEKNVREIRALLKINAEIFSRCTKAADLSHSFGGALQITRSVVNRVIVRSHKDEDSDDEDSDYKDDDDDDDDDARPKTEFFVEESLSKKIFNMEPLTELPASLKNVFVVQYKAEPLNAFIDYDAFFQSAIMLHEDILKPFLAMLKYHIESIHVYLGEIETWLLEPKSNIEFLEKTFELELDFSKYGREKRHVLKVCDDSGKHERNFEITSQRERHKLKKFLEFLDD
jgi:hypothetical protein